MTTLPSKTFCAFPFTHLVTHNAGTYGPCCGASEHFFVDENNKVESNKMFDSVLSTGIKPYGLGIEEAFNSEPMEHIRQELLKGNKPSACASCWKAEKNKLISSKRQTNNNLYFALKPEFENIFDYDPIEISTNSYVRSLDLKFSNKCNLHCLMCSTGNSDMWMPLDEKINQYLIKRNLKRDIKFGEVRDWYDEKNDTNLYHSTDHQVKDNELFNKRVGSFPQKLFEEIKSLIPQLREIQCTGGEPFVSKQFIELLEYAIETGHAEHITLEITTNGTKFVTDVMELLTHFQHIRFLVSVDGTGGTYEYIRAPFKYNLLLERLQVLNDYIANGKINAMIDISAVSMSYNLFDYYNLDEIANIFTAVGPRTYFHNLSTTLYNDDNPLHIKWLPDELLDTALNFYTKRDVIWEQLNSYINSSRVDQEAKLYNQRRMKNYTVLMDKMLNRDYHDFLDPRLVEFLDSVESDL
jgi:MoaA/NifB/PqqE/SkfB family radical SAM enzyme